MSTPLPHWRIASTVDNMDIVEFDLPDFTTGVLTIAHQHVGKPTGDEMIRQAIERYESTKDMLREDT